MPSPEVLAGQGIQAVNERKFEEGIQKLSEAIRERQAPLWLLERSKAHLRTQALVPALCDAERALRVAFDRANRDLMVDAQVRRAIAYFRLRRYADADLCAFWALRLLDGARASEDDGQAHRVDEYGDYAVTAAEVTDAMAGDKSTRGKDGLAAAMAGGGDGRSKDAKARNEATTWRVQALTNLEKLPPGDPGRKIRIKDKYPKLADIDEESFNVGEKEGETAAAAADKPKDGNAASAPGGGDETSRKAAWEQLWDQYRAVHAKNDVRSSFYQTDTTLTVDVFVKNIPKDEFKVDAKDDSVGRPMTQLSLRFTYTDPVQIVLGPIPNTHTGKIHLYLYGKIKPAETSYTVKSMKVELVLKKATTGKWPTLRRKNSELVDNLALQSFPQASFSQFHSYVTSLG